MSMPIRSNPVRQARPVKVAAATTETQAPQPAARPPQPVKPVQARGPLAVGGALTGAVAGGVAGGFGGAIFGYMLIMGGIIGVPIAVPAIAGVLLGAGVGAAALGGAGKLIEWIGSKLGKN